MKSNIIYFPDMGRNYKKELEAMLQDVIDKGVDGKKLAEINSALWLSIKQSGLPDNVVFNGTFSKSNLTFKLQVFKRKK